jgi:hypothetical protein
MMLDDAKRWWWSPEERSGPELSDEEILALVAEKARVLDRTVRARDRRETLAAAVVVVLFAPLLLAPCWLGRAGAALVLAGCAITVVRLWRTRRRHAVAHAGLPLAEVLRAERAKVEAQARLLESVLWWYIAPFALGAVMVVACREGSRWFTVGYAAFVAALSWGIWHLNQRAVRDELRPRGEELTRLLRQMED